MVEPKGRNDGHKADYTKIPDYIYIGSNMCKGGICMIHGEEFRKLGICTEINLTAEEKEYPPDDIDAYIWIPVLDGFPPTTDQLDTGTAIIDQNIKNGNTVYVHCKNGHGRSPTMVAAYLMRYRGMDLEEAESFLKKKRPEVHIENSQKEALIKYSKMYAKN